MEKNLTEAYIESLWDLSRREMPDHVIREVKNCLIDYTGCVELGASVKKEQMESYLSAFPADPSGISVAGMNVKASPLQAALVNGFNSHVLELDDGHRYAMLHLSAPVISAMLAAAGSAPMDGAHFIKGIVIGFEATVRLAGAIQPGHKLKGFHATGTCGTVGAALGIAAALDYPKEYWYSTVSAAAASAAGLLQMIDDASELKPFNAGRAAAAALNAAYFGRTGIPGPDDVLGGKRGFIKSLAAEVKEDYLTDGAMPVYAVEGLYRKPYAACRHCHAPIEAALKLREIHGIRPEEIEEVNIATYGLAVYGHDADEVDSASAAKMSMPYSVAAAFVYGKVNYQQFEPECLSDDRVTKLMKRIRAAEDPALSALVPAKRAAIVTVRTSAGEAEYRVDYPLGEPENPIPEEMLLGKYESLMEAAGKTAEESGRILQAIENIEQDLSAYLYAVS